MNKLFYPLVLVLTVLVFCITSVCGVVLADTIQEQLKFAWNWDGTPQTGDEFQLFMGDVSGEYDFNTPVLTIPINEALPEYTGQKEFTIAGIGGTTVRKFFVIRVKRGDIQSDSSNEVFKDFVLSMPSPYNLNVTVVIESQ